MRAQRGSPDAGSIGVLLLHYKSLLTRQYVVFVAQVKAQFKRRSTANNVEIYIPVPEDADSPKFRAAVGTVHYVPEKSAFVWRIKQLPGGKDLMMRAHFGLPSVRGGASFFQLSASLLHIWTPRQE